MSELLSAVRDTGTKIAPAELPEAGEVVSVLGGLIAHLEQHVPDLAAIDLSKVPGLHPEAEAEPPAGEPPAPPAGEPPAPEPPAPAPDPDDEAAEAAKIADLEAQLKADNERIANLQAELATALGSKPPEVSGEGAPPA